MIEKKRLEELIEQETNIYDNKEKLIICLNKTMYKVNDEYLEYYDILNDGVNQSDYFNKLILKRPLEDLFESEKQAEWHLEFGNIERTEKLTLPTWEEAQDERFYYINNFESLTGLHLFISIYKFTNDFEIHCSHGSKIGDYHIKRHFDLRDKKQYLEACRLAKKLFLGEEV